RASAAAAPRPLTESGAPASTVASSASEFATFFAARLGSATGVTVRSGLASATASLAWPTTAIAPSARADARASATAVAAAVTNRPSSTARLSLISHVLATRRLDVRGDPGDPEELLEEEPEIPVSHDEEVLLPLLDAAAGTVGADAAVVDRAVGEHEPIELRDVDRLADRHEPRVDRDRLERDQRPVLRAAPEGVLVDVGLLEARRVL